MRGEHQLREGLVVTSDHVPGCLFLATSTLEWRLTKTIPLQGKAYSEEEGLAPDAQGLIVGRIHNTDGNAGGENSRNVER